MGHAMLRQLPYRAFSAGILGQLAVSLSAHALGAIAIPCCDNPTPEIPLWYANVATPIYFLDLLLPAFLCGFFALSRPILVGTVAAGLGSVIWYWIGSFAIAQIFPSRSLGGLGEFHGHVWILTDPLFVLRLITTLACHGAAGAAAASGGYLFRNRVRHTNSEEARRVATDYLARYRAMPYRELCQLVGSSPQTANVVASTGTRYQVELRAFWDDPSKPNAVLRVRAAVDAGGMRAYFPLCEDFLMKPDGAFVGENAA